MANPQNWKHKNKNKRQKQKQKQNKNKNKNKNKTKQNKKNHQAYISMEIPKVGYLFVPKWPLKGHSMVTFVTKIWEFFTFNWSQLLQQTSYQSFRGCCTKYLGWSIHSNPPKN